jgi:hypothetical protein
MRKITLVGFLTSVFLLLLAAGMSSASLQQQCNDPYEPNDSFGEAIPIAPSLIKSYICCDGTDYDYFTFTVDAGDLIYVNLYNLPADYNLCLFDPKQQMIKCSNNSGTALETIKETATDSGYHYAQVYGSQGACDSEKPYSLDLQVIPQPPTITSGPTATQVLSTSAVITWTTNKNSDSLVKFGQYAGAYKAKESDPTLAQDHEIILTGLEPATVYHYLVESTDTSSNTVTSGERFFETAPPDLPAPTIYSPTVARADVDRELYKIAVPVSDMQSVERVEFYMNGRLIGIDYSADPLPVSHLGIAATEIVTQNYSAWLDPAKLKMDRADFFSKQHTIIAKVFGLKGLIDEQTIAYMPPFEPPDIDLQMWPRYHPTFFVDGADGTLPEETTIDVSMRASEDEWSCTWVPLTGDMFCGDVAHAVERVVFEVDSTPVYTSYPDNDGDFYHDYTWDVSGLGVGTYQIAATAHGSEGQLRTLRTLTVELGDPSLDLSRSVTREGNYFRVRLTLENEGTGTAGISHIRDNVIGFQPIMTSTANYTVVPEYWVETNHCDVEIDVFTGTEEALMLPPGESTAVEYLAVPILYAEADTPEYGFGTRDEVLIWDQGGFCRWRPDRPDEITSGGELIAEAVGQAKAASDYLLVTHPRNLYRDNVPGRSGVDELLAKMAELAQLKSGLLGYVSVWNAEEVRSQIVVWGDGMRGSDGVDDHFLSNGYVLLVGEAEILGSWDSDHGSRRGTVHYTDLPYGNTSGDWVDPELIVSRVVGNNAVELMTPLQTSINVHRGEPNYHFTKSRALVVSGRGDGVSEFEANVNAVSRLLRSVSSPFASGSVTTKKQRYVEDTEGLDITWVFTSNIPTLGRDLIYYRNHCGAFGWGDGTTVIDTGHFPLDFGERKPFVFACCCQAGRYEALGAIGIAEAFLQNEAGVYIGATENSNRSQNNEASEWFFDRWADRSESIGQSFKALKRHLDGRSGWYWAAEYNLYGDPKYGVLPTLAGLASPADVTAAEPITSVSVIVPAYEVTSTLSGEHLVRIPGEGSGMLLEEGQSIVPVFYKEIAYAPGYRVQDVLLTARAGLTTTKGLSITMTSVATDSVSTAAASPGANGEGWHPALEQVFDWSVRENPDGSSTLVIKMYPFYYHAATGDAKFYRNYSFDIHVVSSTVAIEELTTDEAAYPQGDEVLIDLLLNNSGDAQDVIVDAQVQTQMGETVDGLLLRSLKALTGTASFSPRWDSTGFAPGYYRVEAQVRDGAGNVLDRKMEQFRLGIVSGEVTALTATPSFFDVGETISTSLTFSNTGTVAITGTARVEIQDDEGETVETFAHAVTNQAPSEAVTFENQWNTSGAEEGAYSVIGYVLYDAKATEIEMVTVNTEAYIYLPLVLRSNP